MPNLSRRFRVRFSVRTFMVVIVPLAAFMGWWINSAKSQRNLEARIRAADGWVHYSCLRYDEDDISPQPRLLPGWLVFGLGPEYFGGIDEIGIRQKESKTNETIEILDKASKLRGLKQLFLCEPGLHSEELRASLGHFEQITNLLFSDEKEIDDCLERIDPIKNLKYLATGISPPSDKGLLFISRHRSLNTLILTSTQASDIGIEHISHLDNLACLHLGGSNFSHKAFESLSKLGKLEEIQIASPSINFDNVTMEHLAQLRHLKELRLWNTRGELTTSGIVQLGKLRHLYWIDMENIKMDALDFSSLSQLSNLQWLTVGTIPNGSLKQFLRSISPLKNLKELHLAKTRITDQNIPDFVELVDVEHLRLVGSEISAAGVQSLMNNGRFKTLFIKNSRISESEKARLSTRAGMKLWFE